MFEVPNFEFNPTMRLERIEEFSNGIYRWTINDRGIIEMFIKPHVYCGDFEKGGGTLYFNRRV